MHREMVEAFNGKLGEQINKLRFIRGLIEGFEGDFTCYSDELMVDLIEGLGAILQDTIKTYDETRGLLPI